VLPVGVQLGSGVQPVSVHKIFSQGVFEETKNPLDIYIEGEGFFQVNLPDGTTAYTRTGEFKLDKEGTVMTSEGFPLSPAITIPPGVEAVSINPEGQVSVKLAASPDTPTVIGTIELTQFINPEGLSSLGKNMYQITAASGDPVVGLPGQEGFGRLLQGLLEASNVNIAEEMVNMITSQRAYELNSKAIQASDEMLALVNGLKR
jgi:flagellar basal-body rod protein FlgG